MCLACLLAHLHPGCHPAQALVMVQPQPSQLRPGVQEAVLHVAARTQKQTLELRGAPSM